MESQRDVDRTTRYDERTARSDEHAIRRPFNGTDDRAATRPVSRHIGLPLRATRFVAGETNVFCPPATDPRRTRGGNSHERGQNPSERRGAGSPHLSRVYRGCPTGVRGTRVRRARERLTLPNADPNGSLKSYHAILPETGVMGGYVYAAGFSSADVSFATLLFDVSSGELVAVLDGAALNTVKTGAVDAVGVDALARDDASPVAVIGSGVQARAQLTATSHVRHLETVRVYSPTRANREAFADDADAELAAAVEAVDSSRRAVADADIVVTATDSPTPVVDWEHVDVGTHITAIGQYEPHLRELDTETVANAVYVPDLRKRALDNAGAFLVPYRNGAFNETHIGDELGEVLAGRGSGRTSENQVTVFDSGGTGIETVAAAHVAYRRALEADVGTTVSFSTLYEESDPE